jgi:hypothetical protein
MNKKEKFIFDKIVSKVKPHILEYGFSPSYGEQGFLKSTTNAWLNYQLLIYENHFTNGSNFSFRIEPYVWVGVKEIEKVYQKVTINAILKSNFDFVTIGNSVADLLVNEEVVYRKRNQTLNLICTNEEEIDRLSRSILSYFIDFANSYFNVNSSITRVDFLLNSQPNEYKVNARNDTYRIIKGLIAARLCENIELEKLLDIYRRQIIERDMYNTKPEFDRLIEYFGF